MDGDTGDAPRQGHSVDQHPRIRSLSPWARDMYCDLLEHASPIGDVVAMRVDRWSLAHPEAYAELVAASLLEDYGGDCYGVVQPETLDLVMKVVLGEVP